MRNVNFHAGTLFWTPKCLKIRNFLPIRALLLHGAHLGYVLEDIRAKCQTKLPEEAAGFVMVLKGMENYLVE